MMQTSTINTPRLATSSAFSVESRNGRPDFDLASALQKVSPKEQARAQKTATDFEAMFLNSMFSQMTSGLKGEGPFGDTPGTGVWRSMLTEQYSKNFAQAGGVGIASEVYRTLIMQQAKTIRTA
ncbi:chemotaxis protein chel [Bradyrhizobium sp. WBOS7]|uniref:Chemotaxis protein chel n=2 Tax=Nitrobacteraceae TaxID=41294 RepID=A0AAE9SUJ5_9BRAD|nr:chemotaxis protein chel [Bradyrhizobium sp. WBOS2]MDD1569217.1 chemotaxis protein chel [Bradyrhizobium sp. WBOS1]MDD1576336.1 chemotaxis protein chel [Bradyrhizobium sp. WBOS7]MDD1603777.1 chemotaxis protein chel [Bradyrhizobium sp. WBOS16]UUO38019.1 chemotaxis protein chel [Bradyrhizobium sp. WBOS01]UUO44185.1 chemotaxis protein chel [Bradyrhizobium sp. WBOS02]UUO54592.1 chemotaxis protein chel [Bradyrhizobium sp. WBOS07]UUO68593.1 chemotaxis protein chel [Bradyrhizobium betae]